ncbi:MAG: hypothetical protein GY926_03055 [bacterium]|nr:hypothetical protein [bacterium]
MDRFRVDADWLNRAVRPVIDVFPDEERSKNGKEVLGQKRDRDSGLPLWKLEVPVKGDQDKRASLVVITVGSTSSPDLVGRQPVFDVVTAFKWQMTDESGRVTSGVAIRAESFGVADEVPTPKRSRSKSSTGTVPMTPPAPSVAAG